MATKHAIGKKRQIALDRIQQSGVILADRLDLEPLDLASVTFRDPAFQEAARFETLANWLDMLTETFESVNLSDASEITDNVNLVRSALYYSLPKCTNDELRHLLEADLKAEPKGHVKQEFVNQIVAELTGLAFDVEDLEGDDDANEFAPTDAPDAEDDAEQEHDDLLSDFGEFDNEDDDDVSLFDDDTIGEEID